MDTHLNESQRLTTWMHERGFDYRTLAEATGDDYSHIFLMAKGKRPVSDAFKWRFTLAFGWDEAERAFAVAERQMMEA